ncbi:MAG: protein-L-isoaspartate O-methyltransferase [Actinomycetota bacterium]|nr:methyltransferase domain-containing protein [Actinomycetota bacterium]
MTLDSSAARASQKLRLRLVDRLVKNHSIKTEPVKEAFSYIPRELFLAEVVSQEGLGRVYDDVAIPTMKDEHGMAISSSSQPAIMAVMLEMLAIEPGMNVLEVGAGTGYNAALMAHIAGKTGSVTSIDIEPGLVALAKGAVTQSGAKASIRVGDGRKGWRAGSPYDRIVMTASCDVVPLALLDQLKQGGRLVVPLRLTRTNFDPQLVVAFEKRGRHLESIHIERGGFMGMRASAGAEAPRFDEYIYAGHRHDGKDVSWGSIFGSALYGITERERRVLMMNWLAEGRTVALPTTQRIMFDVFLSVMSDDRTVVRINKGKGRAVALFDRQDGSIAYLADPTTARFMGGRRAQRAFMSTHRNWERLGRPGFRNLRLRIRRSSVPAPQSLLTLERGAAVIDVDWLP